MASLAVEMTGDESDVVKSLARTEKKILAVEKRLRQVNATGKRTSRSISQGFGTSAVAGIKQLTSALGITGGLAGAWQLVRSEIQNVINVQKQAAGLQVSTASSRKDLIRNLSGQSDKTIKGALTAGRNISAETNVDERFIFQALASAVSASSQDVGLSESAVLASAKFLADKPASIAGFAGALLDLSKVTKSRDAEVNAGFLQQVGALSRIVDPELQAKNIAPALIGQQAFGATPAEGAALFSALTGASGDVTGERTGTGAIRLTEQLEEFFKEDRRARRAKRDVGIEGELTAGGRIGLLQERPELAARFIKGASFRAKLKGPIRQLLLDVGSEAEGTVTEALGFAQGVLGGFGGGGIKSVSTVFRENLSKIGTDAELKARFRKSLKQRDLDVLEKPASLQRAFTTKTDEIQLANITGGTGSITREGLKGVLKASGVGAFRQKIAGGRFEASTRLGTDGATQEAIDILGERRDELLQPTRRVIDPTGSQVNPSRTIDIPRQATEFGKETAHILQELIDTLRETISTVGENTNAVEGNTSTKGGEALEFAQRALGGFGGAPLLVSGGGNGDVE